MEREEPLPSAEAVLRGVLHAPPVGPGSGPAANAVKMVDLGGDEPTLRGALQAQMKAAKADKKEVLA